MRVMGRMEKKSIVGLAGSYALYVVSMSFTLVPRNELPPSGPDFIIPSVGHELVELTVCDKTS